MKQVALGDYILAKKIGESDRKVGDVIIPGSQQSLLTKAKVLSIGEGKKIQAMNLEVGDVIFYNEIESNNVAVDGTQDSGYFIRNDFIFGKEI